MDDDSKLKEFIDFYDNSFWYNKIHTLDEALKDEGFLERVNNRFKPKDKKRLKKNLEFEMFMTSLHIIESLFMLIGSLVFNPNNPREWMSDPKNHSFKVIGQIKDGSLKNILGPLANEIGKNFGHALYFDASYPDEWKRKVEEQTNAINTALYLLAAERLHKGPIYNDYKHGARGHIGEVSLNIEKDGHQVHHSNDSSVVSWKFKDQIVEINNKGGEKHLIKLTGPFMVKIQYDRHFQIAKLALTLMHNLTTRHMAKLEGKDILEYVPLPTVEDLHKLFEFHLLREKEDTSEKSEK